MTSVACHPHICIQVPSKFLFDRQKSGTTFPKVKATIFTAIRRIALRYSCAYCGCKFECPPP